MTEIFTALGLIVGLLMGGQPQIVGVRAYIEEERLIVAPTFHIAVDKPPFLEMTEYGPAHMRGMTLGGTIITPSIAPVSVLRYEAKHLQGWMRYGAGYAVKVFAEPCKYDPLAPWAMCP